MYIYMYMYIFIYIYIYIYIYNVTRLAAVETDKELVAAAGSGSGVVLGGPFGVQVDLQRSQGGLGGPRAVPGGSWRALEKRHFLLCWM